MKHFFWAFTLLLAVLLASCAPGGLETKCEDGVCVDITIEGPVRASEPAPFTISVKTEKDIDNLGISLDIDSNATVKDIEKSPKEVKQHYKDKNLMSWTISTKAGQEYIISGHVVFKKPTVSYGVFSYGLSARVGNAKVRDIVDSATVYLDARGEQVDASKVNKEGQSDFPIPTPPPDLTVVPETAVPSITPLLATPTTMPKSLSTIPAYPAPDDIASTESANKKQPLQTPTLPAYPSP